MGFAHPRPCTCTPSGLTPRLKCSASTRLLAIACNSVSPTWKSWLSPASRELASAWATLPESTSRKLAYYIACAAPPVLVASPARIDAALRMAALGWQTEGGIGHRMTTWWVGHSPSPDPNFCPQILWSDDGTRPALAT